MKLPRKPTQRMKPTRKADIGLCYCGNPAIGFDASGPFCQRCEEIEAYNNPNNPNNPDPEPTEEPQE